MGTGMRVGLIDIEPKVFNTAYMQIAAYHKKYGDTVEWWMPLTDRQFDMVYCSSIFTYTDKSEVPKRAICGGTGFDVTSRLPAAIGRCKLDYSIYPNCRKSFLWFSRGCPRKCPWCVVPQKEGNIHPVVGRNLNPQTEYVVVCDNNFFASPEWQEAMEYLRFIQHPVDFQGIDVRIITNFQAWYLSELKHHKQIKFAWDDPDDERKVLAGIKRLTKYIKPWQLMCYVLIGYWQDTEDKDLYRVERLRALGIDPFVMPYDRNDLYERAFARWVNHKAIFKKVAWDDYRRRVEQQEAAGNGWSKPKGFGNENTDRTEDTDI